MSTTPSPHPSEPGPDRRPRPRGARGLWVLVGAALMGGIALGTVVIVLRTGFLFRIDDPRLRFWAFELLTGLGYLVGGFVVALLSPGRTTREPMYAAVLAFVAQTAVLWYQNLMALTPKAFITMLVIDGALAWAGAWVGERITGAD